MWHASVAGQYVEWKLRRLAESALSSVGAAELGQWVEFTGYAYHLRRRLSLAEQALVGQVLDLRGHPEAAARLVAAWPLMVPQLRRLALDELGLVRAPAGIR